MTLIAHCDPIFQFVCRLKRIAHNEKAFHTTLSLTTVRKDVDRLFRKFEYAIINDDNFDGDPDLIKDLLLAFTDTMISQAHLSISPEWQQTYILPEDARSHRAEADFFLTLEHWLQDTSTDANQHLLLFHTCLGLGFTEEAARTTHHHLLCQLDERIDRIIDHNPATPLSKRAYDHINEDNYMKRPLPKLAFYSMAFAALLVVVIFTVYSGYASASSALVEAIETIASH